MAKIDISDLTHNGSSLLLDSESFLEDLKEDEQITQGGNIMAFFRAYGVRATAVGAGAKIIYDAIA